MSNSEISIIHAADFHLGAPFKGISQGRNGFPKYVSRRLLEAANIALSRLVNLCIERKPIALLLAGDLYNPEGGGLKSLNALHTACTCLNEAGIAALIVHGNHDPANMQPSWNWPSNTYVFAHKYPCSVPLFVRNNRTEIGPAFNSENSSKNLNLSGCKLIVHGISHYHDKVTDNLTKIITRHASLIRTFIPDGIPRVGLVHCAAGENASIGEKPYAPCALSDLNSLDIDYWALGHIHKRSQLTELPLACYSGNLQGLHINETGSKGCLQIHVERGARLKSEFCPLAPVEWHNLDIDLSAESSIEQIQTAILGEISKLAAARRRENVVGIIVRLNLQGRTQVHSWLHNNLQDLQSELQARLPTKEEFVWIKDIELKTAPVLDVEQLRSNRGLLGQTLREIAAASAMTPSALPDLLLNGPDSPLAALYESSILKQAGIYPPNGEELNMILEEAGLACLDLLESLEKY